MSDEKSSIVFRGKGKKASSGSSGDQMRARSCPLGGISSRRTVEVVVTVSPCCVDVTVWVEGA